MHHALTLHVPGVSRDPCGHCPFRSQAFTNDRGMLNLTWNTMVQQLPNFRAELWDPVTYHS